MMTVPATFNQGSMDIAAAPSDDMLRQQSFQKTTSIALFRQVSFINQSLKLCLMRIQCMSLPI